MRAVVPVLLIALAGCRGASSPNAAPLPPEWSPAMQVVAEGGNRFALDLYGKLREKPGNLFLSPYSVHAALAMTADGAAGTTRDQMTKVLHLPDGRDRTLVAGDIGRFYSAADKPYELSAANALWGQSGFPWRPEFLTRQKERFGAGFNEADFRKDPEAERARINRWVEEKTRDRIKDLLQPGVVTPQTTMVLTNAVYFKGRWAEQFDKAKTRDGAFRLADGRTVTVPMMHHSGTYRHGAFGGTQVLEMPYQGGDLSMVVILPEKPDGLPALEKQLTPDQLMKWVSGLGEVTNFAVTLPRFKVTWDANLNDPLKALGMTEAFGSGADFSGMAATPPGAVSAVVHKAFVDVNEEGTEAAAATNVVVQLSESKGFNADRPFLFLIRDARHSTVLFLGRLTDPVK